MQPLRATSIYRATSSSSEIDGIQAEPEFLAGLVQRPFHYTGVPETGFVKSRDGCDRRADVALDRLEGPW
jgi:hypothetical protein